MTNMSPIKSKAADRLAHITSEVEKLKKDKKEYCAGINGTIKEYQERAALIATAIETGDYSQVAELQ